MVDLHHAVLITRASTAIMSVQRAECIDSPLSALPLLLIFHTLLLLQPILVVFYVRQWIETVMSAPLNQYLQKKI